MGPLETPLHVQYHRLVAVDGDRRRLQSDPEVVNVIAGCISRSTRVNSMGRSITCIA